jgi:hypothetical protein
MGVENAANQVEPKSSRQCSNLLNAAMSSPARHEWPITPGVTDGSLLEGVKRKRGGLLTTESIVMRASSQTVRWVKSQHRSKD